MKTIPHTLERTKDKQKLFIKWYKWSLGIGEDTGTFQLKTFTNRDVFQALEALAQVNFFQGVCDTDNGSEQEDHSAEENNKEEAGNGQDGKKPTVYVISDDSEGEMSKWWYKRLFLL